MTLAAKYKVEWKKPAGTTVTRIPQGCEDPIFMSFFEGFYQSAKEDFGKDKNIDLSTTANQDISKITNLHVKAASPALEALGSNYTIDIYFLENLTKPVKVDDPNEFGKFFNEATYVVDVKSSSHRYMICWQGPNLSSEENTHTSTAMDTLCGGILCSNMSRHRVRQC